MKKEQSYPMLKTGNFYFPYLDKGKKFVISDTLEFEIDRRKFLFSEEKIQKIRRLKNYKQIYFSEYAGPIWTAIEKFIKNKREYKNCWFVPIRLADYGEKTIFVSVDVLKKVK